jgi:hypothetical protein
MLAGNGHSGRLRDDRLLDAVACRLARGLLAQPHARSSAERGTCPPTLDAARQAYADPCSSRTLVIAACGDLLAVGDANGFAGGFHFYDAASGELTGALAFTDEGFATCSATTLTTGRFVDGVRGCASCRVCEGLPDTCARDEADLPLPP